MPYKIPYAETGYYSDLICDYLKSADEPNDTNKLYNRFPSIQNFAGQLEEKSLEWQNRSEDRKSLVTLLQRQYGDYDHEKVHKQINLMAKPTTFTVTTGHQLNLFTGPLYFLYKIVSTIKLARQLKELHPKNDFVPIFWMASEDHDFEEIQYFHHQQYKVSYDRKASGAVGRMSTTGMEAVLQTFEKALGDAPYTADLLDRFRESYLKHSTLAEATRHLAHSLFARHGLVIVDADAPELKKQAIPHFTKELTEETAHQAINRTLKQWPDKYGIQVDPRKQNLFYLTDERRERIIREDDRYFVNNTDKQFKREEILEELKKHPERFSPNVVLRPLYQEIVLPNLCYIGGGGELAYWLELKDMFKAHGVSLPVLLLRNSALLITRRQQEKLKKLDLKPDDLFQPDHKLEEQVIRQISKIRIDFSPQRNLLRKQFANMYDLANHTDRSFVGAVAAQEKKQLNGLDHLEKRLLKAQKRKLRDHTGRALKLKRALFPKDSLQERVENFSTFYKIHGPALIDLLMEKLEPLDHRFSIIEIE